VTKKQLQDLMSRLQRGGAPDPLNASLAASGGGSDTDDRDWTSGYIKNGSSDPLQSTSFQSRGMRSGNSGGSNAAAAAEMYRAKKRSLIVVSRLKAQALKAETAYWIQKRLDEMAERKSKGLPVTELPKGLALDKDLLTGDVKNLIPSDSEEEEEEEEEEEDNEQVHDQEQQEEEESQYQ
jgi:hypothetical protein